ncbi:MAG: DUF1329 domain-containing protein [Pseudomonadales bacterium]|jgi:hypothetical protein|nr:DUF1329 domain-containing protein [Pseudomonadales bacterium]
MKTKIKVAVSASVLLLATAVQVEAKVTQAEADKLGTELTRMGANPKGNADGTIPEYTGTTLGVPKGVDYKGTGTYYPNPYPAEKPLFVIDGKNYEKYKENLTDGQVALFKKYPDTFKMKVYPSKRDVRYADRILDNVKRNAVTAEIVPSGNGTKNAFGGAPFPIPKNGVEVIWNHQYSPNPFLTEGVVASGAVFNNGSISMRKQFESRYFEVFDPKKTYETFSGTSARVLVEVTDPPREKGKVTLVHEFMDLTELPRNAWQYLPGTRRVRRAPTIAYDFPDGPGGLRTVDDALAFIGATDRYDWKLEPSRELYIPYNNYEADSPAHKYADILTVNHPNPEFMRYELHRNWVVVGTLKEGKRHIYGKRRLYMEEDSWQALLADNYDSQGSLWRTTMRTTVNAYDMPGMTARQEIYHDLQKGAYLLNNLVNEEGGVQKIPAQNRPDDYYTPANLRVIGK